jgi:DNA-binding transcriptional LysR family regulator
MIDFNELAIFVEVVQAGSFTAAARRLNLPKSNISRKIAQLEGRLQTRLLHRTTRAMRLTEAGRMYFERCERVVQEARSAEELVSGLQSNPSGILRLSAPMAVGADILPTLVKEFLSRYPQVSIDLALSDTTVDFLAHDIDLALSASPAPSNTYVSRRLGYAPRVICASRAYVEARGLLAEPEQLSQHDVLAFSSWIDSHRWRLRRGSEEKIIEIEALFSANDVASVLASMQTGLGVAMLPRTLVAEAIESGHVVALLPEWHLKASALYLQFPSRTHMAPKVRAFIDFLMAPETNLLGLERDWVG